ncbi:hypothetical protein JTE90_001614 [Oedothorax gibbosus]|uniref:Transmembrane protein 209 n=1 Tax=Oedothorax gibbosus TaxID=931172 RepID=A0AAV6VNM2_9ARAC|nr:hypothetical protein JTE90_001614 [Oedothorax gibbosus]
MQTISSSYYRTLDFIFGDRQCLEWKTHLQSPVCRAILRRKYFLSHSKLSLTWAVCYFTISTLLFLGLKTGYILNVFGNYSKTAWYLTILTCFVTSLNAFIASVLYLWSMFCKPMPISPVQQKLFGISDKDPGFEVKKTNESATEVIEQKRLNFSSWRDSFECSNSSMMSVTPINYSYNSWGSNSSGSSSLDTTSSSWNFQRASSPMGFCSTPKSPNEATSIRRLSYTDFDSPYDRPIRNMKQLKEFLKTHEEEDRKIKSLSFDESKPYMSKMLPVDSSPMAMLGKCRYQRSYRMPHSETNEEDSSEGHCSDNLLQKLKINDKMITLWCEKIRKWICQTILVKLVKEIDDINSTLTEIGLPEFHIGKVSQYALHHFATTKVQHLPTLPTILPYIDAFSNQEYLVKRLRDLARGGCMGDFKWNSGGLYADKQWCDDLPTDSTLIIHFMCCYFDAHLPPDPHFPEGKPFTSKYFKKVPEKVVLSKDLTYIYQSNLNPPHFKVVIGEDLFNLQKGRNNLFCALVIFLHYMKTKESGMLGRVNLGPSGMNMLWIIE